MLPEEKAGNHGRYLAALSFFLGFTSGAVYLYSRGVFVRDQIADFGVTRTEISLAFTAIQAVGLAFAPVLGSLVDRYPLRNVMMVGAAWLGVGFFAMSQVTSIVQFAIVGTLVLGLGTGSIGTTANAKLMVSWFDRHRGLALTVPIMGYSTAGILMPPLALHLLETAGWRSAYVLFGGVCLAVVLPLTAWLVRSPPGANAERAALARAERRDSNFHQQIAVFLSFARRPQFWGAVLVFGSMSGVFSGLNLHLFLHYTELGIGSYEAVAILSLASMLGIASKPVYGWLVDQWGARAATLTAVVLCIASMVSFSLVSTHVWLLAAGALFGIAFGGLVPVQAAVVSRLFPVSEFGRAYGSLRLCMSPIMVLCTPVIGAVYDRSGSYVPVFALFASMFAAVAIVARWTLPVPLEAITPMADPRVPAGDTAVELESKTRS